MFTSLKIRSQCKRYCSYHARSLLSKENRQACMAKFQGMQIKQGTHQNPKRAVVLIPIYVNGDEVSLLYTVRAAHLKTHRGQVCFPGGMVEQADYTFEHTAFRETHEELGISPKDIDLWGRGNMIIRNDMTLVPIIGCIRENLDFKDFKFNADEVKQVFTVKIQDLIDPKYHKHTQFRDTYTTPTYFAGPQRIWGLTAVLTFMFLKALLPPESYTYKIKYIQDVMKVITKKS